MRKNKALAIAVASALFGGVRIAGAQSSTVLFTTEADWAGSWAINSNPLPGTQSGWAGWGVSAATYMPPPIPGAAPSGQGTSNSIVIPPTETLSFNGPDLDGSTNNGLGNYDNDNDPGTGGPPDPNYTGTSFVGYSNEPSTLGGPRGTLPAALSTSPGGSLTINNYQGGYDTVTTGNMLQGGTASGNVNFINTLYGYNGSGILKVDFNTPLGGTTLSTLPSGPTGTPYFLIGFLIYSNNAAFNSGWVNPAPPPGGIQPYTATNPDPGNFGDAAGSYVANNGTFYTGYIPYSGIRAPSLYTNLEFGIIVNSGDSNNAAPPGTEPYAGNVTIDDIEVVHLAEGSSSWASTGGGSWATAANWTNLSVVPNSQGFIADFGQLGAPSTITMDVTTGASNWIIGGMNFNSPGAGYTFIPRSKNTYSPNGGLIIDNGAIPAQIQDKGGTHTFNIPIQLNSTAEITVTNAGDGMVFNNPISGAGGLEALGPGSVTLNASNTYTGATNINGGNIVVTAGGGLPSGSNLAIGNVSTPSTLTLGKGLGAFTLSNLSINDPSNLTVDVSNDSIVVNYAAAGNPSPAPSVELALTDGAAGNGGIISSDLPSGYAVGYVDNGSSLLIERTLIGDTNLDGTVNLTDLLALLNNFDQTGATWSQGDFNYDGTVNLTDLLGLLNNYGQTASSSAFASPHAVPEPALTGLALVAVGLLARRRP